MKNFKSIIIAAALICTGIIANAQSIIVGLKNGEQLNTEFSKRTFSGKGIELDNGEILEYIKINRISTDNFKAYENASKRAEKKGSKHILVEFTGDESIYALQLEKLQKKRTGAHAARATGGIMTLIGVLSGDRALTAAGIVTHGAGEIARSVNTEKTIATQNQMLNELHENQKSQPQETEEEKYRREYGNENVDAVIALLDNDFERASALANAGETSKDANHRLSTMYVKAIIATDMDDLNEADKAYEKMVIFDPEIEDKSQAKQEIEILIDELNKMRNS